MNNIIQVLVLMGAGIYFIVWPNNGEFLTPEISQICGWMAIMTANIVSGLK